MTREELNGLSSEILDACIYVHREMGPGLLESVYVLCLREEFKRRSIRAVCEVPIGLTYRGAILSKEFRIDILVEDEIILEVKSVDALLSVHEAQVISYLKLAKKRLGFLINFNVPLMKDGFRRFVNGF
jgi:GxxExxY protein